MINTKRKRVKLLTRIVSLANNATMKPRKHSFEKMQAALMHLVDLVNESHAGGVDFGIGTPLYPAEIHTVAAIKENEGISITELAALLNISKPTISTRIRALEGKGLVKKEFAPNNRKAITLWLTPDGNTAYQNHELHHQKIFDLFLARYGDHAPKIIDRFTDTFEQAAQVVTHLKKHHL